MLPLHNSRAARKKTKRGKESMRKNLLVKSWGLKLNRRCSAELLSPSLSFSIPPIIPPSLPPSFIYLRRSHASLLSLVSSSITASCLHRDCAGGCDQLLALPAAAGTKSERTKSRREGTPAELLPEQVRGRQRVSVWIHRQ